jgi:hypothetical protein
MTVATGGRGNVRVRAFTGENLNIRVFRRRRFRSGPSNQGGFGIYPLRGSVHVRTEGPSRQTSPAAGLDRPARLSDAAASPPERRAPEPAVITAMGQNLNIRVFTGVVPSIELLVQLLSTSK